MTSRLLTLVATVVSVIFPGDVLAESTSGTSHRAAPSEVASAAEHSESVAATPAPAVSLSDAGVVVIVLSLAAGAALTAYGLSIDCSDDDHACHRRASLPIWGGAGVATAGSLVGLGLTRSAGGTQVAVVTLNGHFN